MAKHKNVFPWLIGGAVVLVGGGIALASMMGEDESPEPAGGGGSTDFGGDDFEGDASSPSFEETARAMAREAVTVQNCNVKFISAPKRTAFLGNSAFWRSAVQACVASSLITPDLCASKIASLMVPGCPWPPTALEGLDIQAAVDGTLDSLAAKAQWSVVKGLATVDFYLTIRAAVVPLL